MHVITFIPAIFTVLCMLPFTVYSACSERLKLCMSDMSERGLIQVTMETDLDMLSTRSSLVSVKFRPMSEILLERICDNYIQTERCMTELYNCDPYEWDIMGSVRSTIEYMCDASMRDYLKYASCLGAIKPGSCRSKLSDHTTWSDSWSTQTATNTFTFPSYFNYTIAKPEALCNGTRDYIDCLLEASNTTCGVNASSYYRELILTMLEPFVDNIQCDLGYISNGYGAGDIKKVGGLSLGAVAAIGLTIALSVAAFAVGVRYLCIKYGGDLDDEEDELLYADDRQSQVSDDSPPRASTASRTSAPDRPIPGGASAIV